MIKNKIKERDTHIPAKRNSWRGFFTTRLNIWKQCKKGEGEGEGKGEVTFSHTHPVR